MFNFFFKWLETHKSPTENQKIKPENTFARHTNEVLQECSNNLSEPTEPMYKISLSGEDENGTPTKCEGVEQIG